MQYTTLGRTGLNVSVLGLGAGGPSRLGQHKDKTEADSIAIVRQALDAGINQRVNKLFLPDCRQNVGRHVP